MTQKFKSIKHQNHNFLSPEQLLDHVFRESLPLYWEGIRLDTLNEGLHFG